MKIRKLKLRISNQHKMLWNYLEKRPNARWEGEFECLKTLQGPQLENCRKYSGSENLKENGQTAPTSPHVVWEGFKKNYPHSSKNIFSLQHIELSDTTGTSNGTGFYGQMKQKKENLAANTQDGFGEHRDKKYPMCTMKYTAVFLMLTAYISARGPGHLI